MNPYLQIILAATQIIDHHANNGMPAPQVATDVIARAAAALAAFESLKSGIQTPDSVNAVLADLNTAVAALGAAGVSMPEVAQGPVALIVKFAATRAAFEAGQAVFLGDFEYADAARGIAPVKGDVWATVKGGPGEAGLIGSNE